MSLAALSTKLVNILNGAKGYASPLAEQSRQVKLGDRLNEIVTNGTRLTVAEVKVAAAGAENTDVEIPVDLNAGKADGGTFTYAITSAGVKTLTHTPAAPAESYWLDLPIRARTSALKGAKILGLKASYTAGVAAADDIRFEIWKRVQPADNASPAAPAVVGGNLDAHYDAAHDTIAERVDITGAPEKHTLVMTLPAPVYIAAGEEWMIRVLVDGNAGASNTFVLTDLRLICSETLVDLA